MNRQKNKRDRNIRAGKLFFLICVVTGIILFNKYFDLDSLKKIHIEKEKELGDREINQELFRYDSHEQIVKSILTDYHYLFILPGLEKYSVWGVVNELQPENPVFGDTTIGYLLATPSSTNEIPAFIESKIKSGEYKEIFYKNGYRFIKIR
jgi:hypothetical protein